MRAISLWQPYASLVAIGAKPDETRSWPAPKALIGQDLAICSALRCKPLSEDVHDPIARQYITEALAAAGLSTGLPYGKVLCVVRVVACIPTGQRRDELTDRQEAFGDYTLGRFAWLFDNVRRLRYPQHVCGRQGIFDYTLPEGMFGQFES